MPPDATSKPFSLPFMPLWWHGKAGCYSHSSTPLLPGGSLVLMRDGKPNQITSTAFAERVGKAGKSIIEERIHNPILHIDSDLAVV